MKNIGGGGEGQPQFADNEDICLAQFADKEDFPRIFSVIQRGLVLLMYYKFDDKLSVGGCGISCTAHAYAPACKLTA